MSRKVLNLGLDFDEIRKRIDADKGRTGNNQWAEHIKVSQSLISQIHPQKKGNVPKMPSLEYVIAVSRATGRPVEWYLYGNAERTNPEAAFMCGWTPEIQEACRTVKKILESGDQKTVAALQQNIEAFETSVKRLDENEKLKEEKRIKTLNQSTGTD